MGFSFYCFTNIFCQQYDPQIQKHIKPDFYKLSEPLTSNGGCKFLNKDSTSFTGTAYKNEYISDYYFLTNNTIQDTTSCRIKIIAFKNGFKDGVSQISVKEFFKGRVLFPAALLGCSLKEKYFSFQMKLLNNQFSYFY